MKKKYKYDTDTRIVKLNLDNCLSGCLSCPPRQFSMQPGPPNTKAVAIDCILEYWPKDTALTLSSRNYTLIDSSAPYQKRKGNMGLGWRDSVN